MPDFRNYTLCELPHLPLMSATAQGDRDFATTIARNFLYSALMVLVWDQLQSSKDQQLAAIAAKSLKEARYHLRHSRDWLIRLGDGTEESHARMQAAIDALMPYTREFWVKSASEQSALGNGTGIDVSALQADWNAIVDAALQEATLQRPVESAFLSTGKQGIHSEHLGFVLAEMQSLAPPGKPSPPHGSTSRHGPWYAARHRERVSSPHCERDEAVLGLGELATLLHCSR